MRTISHLGAAMVIAAVLAIVSCHRAGHTPVTVVVICDLSGSIEPDAQAAMFTSVEQIVHRLRRGDTVVVIPLTGDTEAEATGRVLRFEAPLQREVFDEDLIRLGREARKKLEELAATAHERPSPYTDILGAMRIASEEMATLDPDRRAVLVILSDLIEDNPNRDFKRDTALARVTSARTLAAQIARQKHFEMKGAVAYLGLIRSHDFVRLAPERREAVREFWREYLTQLGAHPEIASDGPGLLQSFLDKNYGKPQPLGLIGGR